MIDEATLTELEALRANGAQGEWQFVNTDAIVTGYRFENDKHIANWIAEINHIDQDDFGETDEWSTESEAALANGALIVAAVNNLPLLIASLRECREQLEEERAARQRLRCELEVAHEVLRTTEEWRDAYKDVLRFYAAEECYDEAGVVGVGRVSRPPMEAFEYEWEPDYGYRAQKALGLVPTLEQLATVPHEQAEGEVDG